MDELKYLALIAAAGLLLIATSSQARVSTTMPHPQVQGKAGGEHLRGSALQLGAAYSWR